MHFAHSDAPAPTFFVSFVPSFAHKLKEQEKGIIFFGDTFVFGIIGHDKCDDLFAELKKHCEEMSSKDVKAPKPKDKVKFDFKIKGQKPIETKGVCQFIITGADFKEATIAEALKKHGFNEME